MQTFITHSDPNAMLVAMVTASQLDSPRLGKQRVEAKQIFQGSFPHHPATKMWKGHEQALALYGHVMCSEWIKRGCMDTLRPYFENLYHEHMDQVIEWVAQDPDGSDAIPVINWPWWFGEPHMVASHRDKLLRKQPDHYRQYCGGSADWPGTQTVNRVLPYIWPDVEEEGAFYISKAEIKRHTEWHVPDSWHVDFDTRRVTFDE